MSAIRSTLLLGLGVLLLLALAACGFNEAPPAVPARTPTHAPTARPARTPTARPTVRPQRTPTAAPGRSPTRVPPSPTRQAVAPTATTRPAVRDPDQRSEDLLMHTTIPGRDLYDLTRRLRLKSTAPLTLTARTSPLNRKVGDQDRFYINNIQQKSFYTITAKVRIVTAHAYWYVDNANDPPVNMTALQRSAKVWEDKIYPTDHKYFGAERSPGIDDDPRITILLANIPGVGGYFSSADSYNRVINPYSNEREMIYIASTSAPELQAGPGNYFEGVLAHEFQHMIHNNVSPDRDSWLDEGCSDVAMALNGYSTGGAEYAFLSTPDTQLDAWSSKPESEHYGASYLFLRYMMQRFGGADFLRALLASPGAGVTAFDDALHKLNAKQGFRDAFTDWLVANYVNDPKAGDGRYAYDAAKGANGSRLRVSADAVTHITRYPYTVSADVHQFAGDYISLERGAGDTVVHFNGAPTVKVLDTDPHSGRYFWYSNQRDSSNPTLTHDFDLTGLHTATLDYWTWYDIEGDFDYGYVEVSTDGGQTWDTLKTSHTTDTDPNGANYGHGYTGPSGHDSKSEVPPVWVHEQIDLSAYAGQRVQVRFDYVTDESYNAPGWAVDDIRIPELNYSADAETDDGGWQAAGFVRITNVLPQRWYVAAVETTRAGVSVVPIAVDANGQGTLTILGLGRTVTRAALVISGLAPTTTELATYQVTVGKRTP